MNSLFSLSLIFSVSSNFFGSSEKSAKPVSSKFQNHCSGPVQPAVGDPASAGGLD